MNSGVCVLRLAVRSKSSVCLCTVRCVCVWVCTRQGGNYVYSVLCARQDACECVWVCKFCLCVDFTDHSVFLGFEEYSTYVREKSWIRRFVPPDEDAQNPKTCLRWRHLSQFQLKTTVKMQTNPGMCTRWFKIKFQDLCGSVTLRFLPIKHMRANFGCQVESLNWVKVPSWCSRDKSHLWLFFNV